MPGAAGARNIPFLRAMNFRAPGQHSRADLRDTICCKDGVMHGE